MTWNKYSDWLPLSNAIAQVNFWRGDLAQSNQYLAYVRSYKKYKLPGYNWMLRIALKDVNVSKKGLAKAIRKLEATRKRVKRNA